MKLTITERLILPGILPVKDSISNLLLKRDISDKLAIPADEQKEIDFTVKDGKAQWNNAKAQEKNIELSSSEINYLKRFFTSLDERKEFPEELLSVYEKLM